MAEVARLAGVSVTTVSHVINGTRPASKRTRERVMAAVERTGYRPNTLARALARGGTQSLGLAISGLSNPYFTDVVAAIEAAAGRAGHTLLLGDTREDPEHELRIVRALAERQVDGMLLAPTVGALEHALPYLESQNVPVVLLDRFVDAPLDQVGCDNEQPTARLVEHLVSLGHRRIAMAIGIPGLSTTDERVRGYRMALEQAGIAFDPALVAEGGSQRDRAHEAMLALLGRAGPADRGRLGQQLHDDRPAARDRRARPDGPRRHRAGRLRRLRVGRPVRAAADRDPPADDRARLARGRAAALAPGGSGAAAAPRAARGDVRAPKLMWVPQVLHLWPRSGRNPEAMTTSPRELGITTLLFSIYVSARGGAQVAGAARRLLR